MRLHCLLPRLLLFLRPLKLLQQQLPHYLLRQLLLQIRLQLLLQQLLSLPPLVLLK
jgi:hypothetical protein